MLAFIASSLLIGFTRFLVGGHARWIGCGPEARQRIYFANHASHLDSVLLWAALPAPIRRKTHPVAALDYWGTGVFKRFIALKVLRVVLIDRQGGADPLAPVREVLAKGESIIIFPEGTRQNDALPGPFKSGIYHLVEGFPKADPIPVYLANLARAYPKGALLPIPIHCVVSFGAPLHCAEGESKAEYLQRSHQAVCDLAPGGMH